MHATCEKRQAISGKERVIAHIETCRPDLIFYAGLVAMSGAMLASDHWTVWRLAGAWAAPTLGWFAAMYGGDYFDRDLDAIAKAQRPIPSGRMRPGEALAGMIANIVLGAVIAALLNPFNLIIAGAATLIGVSYSKYFKAHGILGNISRGAITALAFTMGTLATSPHLPLRLLPLGLVFWLHDSGSNVVGAICDADGDRQGGYRTFPVRHGDLASLWLLVGFDVLWLALAAGYPFALATPFDHAAYGGFLAVAAVMGSITVIMLVRAPRPIPRLDALRAHEILVIERLALAAAFIAAVAGVWLGLVLAVLSAGATLLSSVVIMRRSYEPNRLRWRKAAAG
jgi:4-hydroxybenzoate polyprenyltransferase/geranylgeranylglycerol-phosphate geranylgeranyltransferase